MGLPRISHHTIEQYCMRKYNDLTYHVSNSHVNKELEARVAAAKPSKFDPREFFCGSSISRRKARDVTLIQDDEFIENSWV